MSDPLGSFIQGLVGDDEVPGFRGGYAFRLGLADRKRKLATEQENQVYERVRRLREDVAFRLQQRVGEGELAAQGRTAQHQQETWEQERDRRTRIRDAAVAIRANPTLAKDHRIAPLLTLPDEELVEGVKDLATNPQRFERPAGGAAARTEARQDLQSVERQVDDTRADLARAEREMPTRPELAEYEPSIAQRFTADSAAVASRVGALRQRADSLSAVRDSIAAAVQGRSFRRQPAKRRITADQAEYLKATGQWDPNKFEVAGSKTPAQWVSEVRQEHPNWTPEQVAAEARRRASQLITPR
jgi:hypothetical protein